MGMAFPLPTEKNDEAESIGENNPLKSLKNKVFFLLLQINVTIIITVYFTNK
jgi:hypothetical protein